MVYSVVYLAKGCISQNSSQKEEHTQQMLALIRDDARCSTVLISLIIPRCRISLVVWDRRKRTESIISMQRVMGSCPRTVAHLGSQQLQKRACLRMAKLINALIIHRL